MEKSLKAVSLFSSGGIGDLGLKAAGIKVVCANELLPNRAGLFQSNFPDCKMIVGDIHERIHDIIETSKERLNGDELFLLFATPPCQGMSSNGAGKLLSEIRKGNRPKIDPRNSLILAALEVISELEPRWVIFENVVGMQNTVIEFEGKLMKILDIVRSELSPKYHGEANPVQMADYGIPQNRLRLITVYTRDPNGKKLMSGRELVPPPTHGINGKRWISVNEAIGHYPPLDAKTKETAKSKQNYLHQVPVLDSDKYLWIRNTPLNESAFNNQCVNSACGYQNNPRHGTSRVNGINQSKKDTPLYCANCGSLLPRPWVKDKNGNLRLMKGYISAYKRMNGQAPAPTLTTNFSFPCSDNKVHPTQNRVLSYAEAGELQTVSKYAYDLKLSNKNEKMTNAPLSLIREVIGESVPPYFIEQQCNHLINISKGLVKPAKKVKQLTLLNENA